MPVEPAGGEEEGGAGTEEALAARPAPSPSSPAKAEREAHASTHLPYRTWCPDCVMGRARNPAHRPVPDADGAERRRLPEVHMDYAFLRREASDELMKMVVAKVRPSRAARAWVVPQKGVGDAETVERICRGLVEMGIRAPCIFKSDQEHAIRSLREQGMSRMGEGAVPQDPPQGESESNGAVENAVQLMKGMLRVRVLALERKLGVEIPVGHPVVAWLAEAVSDLTTKHLKGSDGRTAFERLYGKPLREEALEFGEVVLWRRPKDPSSHTLLEARWEEGARLGRRWGGMIHRVGIGTEVVETRAVQRKPREERWSRERIAGLRATPWQNPAREGDDDAPAVLPPRGELPGQPVPASPGPLEGPEAGVYPAGRS